MNKYSVKAAACALVGTLSLSGYQITLEAKIHNSSDVPAAGVAVVLDEGSTIQDLQVEVVQNIAYLESASGLQPNIIKASEKVALADASNIVVSNSKTSTAKVSTEFSQELSEAIGEAESDFLKNDNVEKKNQEETQQEKTLELSTEWEVSDKGIDDKQTTEEENSSVDASNEEGSSEESSSEENSEEESSNKESSSEENSEEESSNKESSSEENSEEESSNEENASEENSEEESSNKENASEESSSEENSEEKSSNKESSSEESSEEKSSSEESSEEKSSSQESISEEESSNKENSEEESSNEESTNEESTNEENSEEESSNKENASEESSNEETLTQETEISDTEETDFQASAGFSATETYDDIELEESIESETIEDTDEEDFSDLVIAQVTNYVNVRNTPGEEGEIVGKLYANSVGEFVEEKNGWYKIVSGNCTGYVKGEFCVAGEEAKKLAKEVGTTYAVVNTTTLRVRQDASTESAVLGLVPIEEELVVLEELDGWVKIAIEEGDGYVSKDYVKLRTDFVHAESKEEEEARLAKEAKAREEARAAAAATETARRQRQAETQAQKTVTNQAVIESARSTASSSEGSAMGKAVIDYATQFVGNPYVYGGSSLTNGTDCSGFVMSVYSNFGVSLPHSSSALRSQGYDVGGLSNAQPGDIVCYSGHVGLYVGNGQIVHASTSKTGIIVSNAAYRNVLSVRRIF